MVPFTRRRLATPVRQAGAPDTIDAAMPRADDAAPRCDQEAPRAVHVIGAPPFAPDFPGLPFPQWLG